MVPYFYFVRAPLEGVPIRHASVNARDPLLSAKMTNMHCCCELMRIFLRFGLYQSFFWLVDGPKLWHTASEHHSALGILHVGIMEHVDHQKLQALRSRDTQLAFNVETAPCDWLGSKQ